jgi:uncharacterized protein YbgA (DUF1722 family)/uncharacterized protein YbbK (DUF523 family)
LPTSTVVPDPRVRLGVSACLLGEPVRFDGGHTRNPFLTDAFGRFADWVPVCPEQEAGFGTPRETMRLVASTDGIRLLTVRTRRDVTEQLQRSADERVAALTEQSLDGFVLKQDSPSCGLTRVKVYPGAGPGPRTGRGLFATALAERLPLLPVEEGGRLSDPRLREHFIERVFAARRLRLFLADRPRPADLIRFHSRHKLVLLAHSPAAYSTLGRLVASVRPRSIQRALTDYGQAFAAALGGMATRPRHANVLQHMAGYFRRLVSAEARGDLAGAIEDYRRGLVPLVVPIRLIAHYTHVYDVGYLSDQIYLDPYPRELMLRNHA